MKKFFVSSDIHGFFSEWYATLKEKNFDINNPEHIVIVCGDLLDRGEEAKETVNFVYNLYKQNRFIFIRGNHEDLFDEMILRKEIYRYDVSNGTGATLYQLAKNPDTVSYDFLYDPRWDELKYNAINYYETPNYIFVHGWIPVIEKDNLPKYYARDRCFEYDSNWRDATKKSWEDARWINGLDVCHNGIREPNKTIICGHWHCSWGWSHLKNKLPEFPPRNKPGWEKSFEPFKDTGILAIDACTAYSKLVNVIVLNKDEL